jgi:hypothetical protein
MGLLHEKDGDGTTKVWSQFAKYPDHVHTATITSLQLLVNIVSGITIRRRK